MKKHKKRWWTNEEDNLLIKLYEIGEMSSKEMGKKYFGRSENAVRKRASRLKIFNPFKISGEQHPNWKGGIWTKSSHKNLGQHLGGKAKQKLRFMLLIKHNFKCVYCGRGVKDDAILEIDHKVPLSQRGTHNPLNLTVACRECNKGKRDILLDMYIKKETDDIGKPPNHLSPQVNY